MKDAKGHGSDAHQSGVAQIGRASATLTAQHKAAQANYAENAAKGSRWGTSRVVLPSGHELFTSIRARQSNSRGVNRGEHLATEYNIRAPGEQYSKRIARGKVKDHFK